MSRQQEVGIVVRVRSARPNHLRVRLAAVTMAVTVGLAACGGDDDDAADSTAAPGSTAVESTASETTLPSEITGEPGTSAPDASDATADGTTAETEPAGSDPATAGTDASATESAGSSDATEAPDDVAAAAVASETSAADGAGPRTAEEGASDGSADVGPTTTGPACEFAENSSLPLERCNMGPAVAVVQSLLQADGYAIDTIDGNFGDQTLYAVRAFQEDEGLEVDGIVGLQTWTALDVSQFGTDEDGDGVIEPGEIDLSE